ncbi:MAG: hypothetical protein KC492_08015, partial [Myxococcales bacterium]|nr:hypothetical protein [Myxococcales bacterium]
DPRMARVYVWHPAHGFGAAAVVDVNPKRPGSLALVGALQWEELPAGEDLACGCTQAARMALRSAWPVLFPPTDWQATEEAVKQAIAKIRELPPGSDPMKVELILREVHGVQVHHATVNLSGSEVES